MLLGLSGYGMVLDSGTQQGFFWFSFGLTDDKVILKFQIEGLCHLNKLF